MERFLAYLALQPNNAAYLGVRKIQMPITAETKEQAKAFAVEAIQSIVKEDVKVSCEAVKGTDGISRFSDYMVEHELTLKK